MNSAKFTFAILKGFGLGFYIDLDPIKFWSVGIHIGLFWIIINNYGKERFCYYNAWEHN